MSKIDFEDVLVADQNLAVITEYFKGIASCSYYDGLSYQLYIDADDNTLSIHQEISSNSWLQREDGSLIRVWEVSGYCDIPQHERYTDGCDLSDYGFYAWQNELSQRIAEALGR